ncbi:MAG: DUF2194 domain-containing protein [Actinobacteria bacterium]|nr:DUF2194 domain-containing protein [Actinomycetota bacterium]
MFVKKIIFIIVALLLLAAGFQILRSFGILKLVKNVNSQKELAAAISPVIPSEVNFEKYLIVSDNSETNSVQTENQLKAVFGYMKKDFTEMNIDKEAGDLSAYDCIFFTFERLDFLNNLNGYLDYVNSGGNLVFLTRPVTDKSFESMKTLLGIKENAKKTVSARGIKMLSEVLIRTASFKTDSDIILNSSIDLKLDSNIKPLITSYDDLPVLWEKNYGKGRFVVFNGTILNEKNNRGLLAGIIGVAKEDLIYPVVNVKMVHIDDFPSPVPSGKNEKIYEEFSRDIPQFYREVWWPEMLKIAKKFDIKYSGFVIESYNNVSEPPFPGAKSEDIRNLLIYGKELLGSGGEIGLHGYNHQSLALQGYIKQNLGYKPWKSENDMVLSLRELIGFIKGVFTNYSLKAYVPPSNILSPEGRKAVLEANPDLKIIASIYLPNKENDVYSQELSIAEDKIIEFPRFSAGYEKTGENMWIIYNAVNMYGLFVHFVHPDDVLDPERNGNKSWEQLAKEFSSMTGEINQSYGWLRSFTISPASQELVKYLECEPLIDYKGNDITIYTKNYRPDVYCIMRTNKRIAGSDRCSYTWIADNAYLLTLKDSICRLKLEEK